MRDVRQRAELALQSEERLDVAVAQSLERDDLVSLAIEGLVHDAEPPAPRRRWIAEPLRPAKLFFLRGWHRFASESS